MVNLRTERNSPDRSFVAVKYDRYMPLEKNNYTSEIFWHALASYDDNQ